MKLINNKFKGILLLFVLGLVIAYSCKEDEDTSVEFRLFQPVLNEELSSVNNSIIVNMGKMKRANGYAIEVSRDSFKTVDYSFQVDTNYFVIDEALTGEELLWFTIYQVQATAISEDPQYNSYTTQLGSVRTQKFPSNMGVPTMFDVLDTRARVFWIPSGATITNIKVFAMDDIRLTSPLLEFDVAGENQTEAIINGLEPSTSYQVAIFSGDQIRGWEVYTTREAFISGDNVIDLTGISTEVNLADALSGAVDGGIVVLEGGKTYLAGGYAFDKSLTFMSGYSFTPALPVIDCSENFNLADGSSIGAVHFKQIELTAPGGFESKYVFNIDKSGSIEEIKFESCKIHHLKGITRAKEGTGVLNKYTIDDCLIDSISASGLLSIDVVNTWVCNNIVVQNSTISRAERFVATMSNINTVLVDGCTGNDCPKNGTILFYGFGGTTINDAVISNCIWGRGWDLTGGDNHALLGVFYKVSASWTATNNYVTNDFSLQYASLGVSGFPGAVYDGTINDLWVDPANNDFNIKDSGFMGKGDAGDPRWRIGL